MQTTHRMNSDSVLLNNQSILQRLTIIDWLWAVIISGSGLFLIIHYFSILDHFEISILAGVTIGLLYGGWQWNSIKTLTLVCATTSLTGIYLYGGVLTSAQHSFILEYLLSSQAAILWMSALYILATLTYLMHLFTGSVFSGQTATALTWSAITMGLTGMMVRWWESYLISPDVGHIPVSNLYEVFILFCIITSIIYLHYEYVYKNRSIGAFVMLVISAAVGFLLWYTYSRGADQIQPLVPALQSYWMKIHVPANFIGYGCFSIAAMLGAALLFTGFLQKHYPDSMLIHRLPDIEMMDAIMYKSIALGFMFFTLATILGALWAAEAWGGYWSWDPKETWALIVWLNYAAWLHMRMSKGWRGNIMAWWSVIGLFVTLFAFLGVNMFLSGLHSYGEL